MAERTGLAAILDEAGAGDSVLETPAEQLALLGMEPPQGRSVAGRPPGRRNLRNQRVADFILATVGDPLVELARMAMLPVNDMQAALGVTKAEAFAEKRLCAAAVLPYLHQRQAIAVDLTSRNIVTLNLFEGAAPAAPGGGGDIGMTIMGSPLEIVTDQGVSDDGER